MITHDDSENSAQVRRVSFRIDPKKKRALKIALASFEISMEAYFLAAADALISRDPYILEKWYDSSNKKTA